MDNIIAFLINQLRYVADLDDVAASKSNVSLFLSIDDDMIPNLMVANKFLSLNFQVHKRYHLSTESLQQLIGPLLSLSTRLLE